MFQYDIPSSRAAWAAALAADGGIGEGPTRGSVGFSNFAGLPN